MSKRLFAIVKITEPKKMAELIEAKFPSRNRLNEQTWLVAGDFTVMEVSELLCIGKRPNDEEEGEYGNAVVLGVHAYYGRASEHLWDWMNVKTDV